MPKPFWDVEENDGFVVIQSNGLPYKVWKTDNPVTDKLVADTLAKIRNDLNKLFVFLCKNKDLWINKKIAFGVVHALGLHLPALANKNTFDEVISRGGKSIQGIQRTNYDDLLNVGEVFNYQEMTPNNHGIIGLNKPKQIIKIKIPGSRKSYEIADKRSVFLTIRRNGILDDYNTIMKLVIHEVTHTVCNDVRWKPDNHLYPYPLYHKQMIEWAKEIGILK